jgi:RNA polymerase sigma-54 factor
MDLGLRLETQQKLVMTQELRQAIEILQLSTQELAAMVEQQFLENPVLEMDLNTHNEEASVPEGQKNDFTAEDIGELDEYLKAGMRTNSPIMHSDKQSFERYASRQVSLQEHLQFQLDLCQADSRQHAIGQYIIGCIDDKGYLCMEIDEIAQALGETAAMIYDVLVIIQSFDPEGVGARNLQECLQLQARQKGLYQGLVKSIIDQHLGDLAAAKFRYIADRLNCTPHEVQKAVDLIRTFNPKPGLAYGGEVAGYITPDVTVERVDQEYVILINDSMIPRLMINPSYRQAARLPDHEVKKYIESKVNAAVWLLKSVEQRRSTLLRVTEAIIELQRSFFDHGRQALRPLIMKTVADRLGVHESTVSRAVANKYMDTPHGLISMRAFFSSSINSSSGEEVAAGTIKQEIKALIQQEDSSSPLSDQAVS